MVKKWQPPNVRPEAVSDFVIEGDSDDSDMNITNDLNSYSKSTHNDSIQYNNTTSTSNANNNSNSNNNNNTINNNNNNNNNIGSADSNAVQFVERQYNGENTLDEPVFKTLSRDLKKISHRLISVIWPNSLRSYVKSQQNNILNYARNSGIPIDNLNLNLNLNINIPNIHFSSFSNSTQQQRNGDNESETDIVEQDNNLESSELDSLNINPLDWDLWGPLIFILFYSILITIKSSSSADLSNSNNDSNTKIFSSSFTIIWFTFFLISINIQLLGGKISLFLALSSIGYCLFPLDILALITIFVKWYIVKFILSVVFTAWSIYSCSVALSCSGIVPNRSFLALYPVCLCYIALGWMCVVS